MFSPFLSPFGSSSKREAWEMRNHGHFSVNRLTRFAGFDFPSCSKRYKHFSSVVKKYIVLLFTGLVTGQLLVAHE